MPFKTKKRTKKLEDLNIFVTFYWRSRQIVITTMWDIYHFIVIMSHFVVRFTFVWFVSIDKTRNDWNVKINLKWTRLSAFKRYEGRKHCCHRTKSRLKDRILLFLIHETLSNFHFLHLPSFHAKLLVLFVRNFRF